MKKAESDGIKATVTAFAMSACLQMLVIPIESVTDSMLRRHQLKQQQQSLDSHAEGGCVDHLEERMGRLLYQGLHIFRHHEGEGSPHAGDNCAQDARIDLFSLRHQHWWHCIAIILVSLVPPRGVASSSTNLVFVGWRQCNQDCAKYFTPFIYNHSSAEMHCGNVIQEDFTKQQQIKRTDHALQLPV